MLGECRWIFEDEGKEYIVTVFKSGRASVLSFSDFQSNEWSDRSMSERLNLLVKVRRQAIYTAPLSLGKGLYERLHGWKGAEMPPEEEAAITGQIRRIFREQRRKLKAAGGCDRDGEAVPA